MIDIIELKKECQNGNLSILTDDKGNIFIQDNTTQEKLIIGHTTPSAILSEDEILTLDSYLAGSKEDGGMQIAFGNSDWVGIYKKITNGKLGPYAKQCLRYWADNNEL